MDFTIQYSSKFNLLEQDAILFYFSPNIGYLPFKYGMFLIDIKQYKKLLFINKYNITEVYNAIKDPSIIHLVFCIPKVWNKNTRNSYGSHNICKIYQKIFYYYAKKTNCYSKIYNLYMANNK